MTRHSSELPAELPDSFTPLTLNQLSDMMQVVIRVGVLMLRSGTVSFRVEQAMQRVALGLGVERLDAYVTLTGITASIHCGNQHYTQIARVKSLGVDMNRVSAVEYLTLHLPADATPATVSRLLDKIEQLPPQYPQALVVAGVASACGAFAILSGGGGIDGFAALMAAGVGLILRYCLLRTQLNPIAVTVICAAVATLVCYSVVSSLGQFGWTTPNPQSAFLAAVLFQVPGMLLVTAALDLVRLDLISGISRIAYALIQLFSVAIGILFVLPLTGLRIL